MHKVYEGKLFRCGLCTNWQEWGLGVAVGLCQLQFRHSLIALSTQLGPFMAFFDVKAVEEEGEVDVFFVEKLKK